MSSTPSRKSTGMPRIAVIGAGVIGLACALELKRRGADVVVYERGTEFGAGVTARAAGMLGVAFEWALEADQLALAALARRAGDLWPDFAAGLERQGGGPIEFSPEGALVVARTAADVAWIDGLAAACQVRGLPVKRLSATDLKHEDRAITGQVQGGLLLEGDRQVDPQLLLQRLTAVVGKAGVGVRYGRMVERIGVASVFHMPDGDRFDRIVLATGAGALPRFVGARGEAIETGLPELVPVKGQMLALAPVEGAPRHVIHTRDVYIAPKSRWILVGATSERGKSDTATDAATIAKLRESAAAVAGALENAPEIAAWAGVRPGTPDDQPLIGETAVPGVYAALGHYRNGVLFAPATAEIVAELAIDAKVSPLARPFDARRFDKRASPSHSRSAKA
jgi:glycine oxidase